MIRNLRKGILAFKFCDFFKCKIKNQPPLLVPFDLNINPYIAKMSSNRLNFTVIAYFSRVKYWKTTVNINAATELNRIKANSLLKPSRKIELGQFYTPAPICKHEITIRL